MNVLTYYALFLALHGDSEKALDALNNAKKLDPLAPEIPGYSLLPLYFAGKHDRAIELLQAALKNDPGSINLHSFLAMNLEQLPGKLDEAITEFELAREEDAENSNPESFAQLGHAYALAGKTDKALEILDKLKELQRSKFVSSYNFALVYVGLGQTDQAITALENAAEQRTDWFACLKVDPRLDPLRDDPRFEALLKKANLSE